jgi:hypothetical protein
VCAGESLFCYLRHASGYQHSINEFISGYCSEPRLSFNKTGVTRYRIYLESRPLAPGTINVRLAAVVRLAYEAADSGLLSPELSAGIQRVKRARKLGDRLGNWLTAEQARGLWQLPTPRECEREARSSDSLDITQLRAATPWTGRSDVRSFTATRRSLGRR